MNEPFDWKIFQQTMKQLPGVSSQGKTPAFDLSWVEQYVRDTIDETNRTVSKAAKSYSDSAKQKQRQTKEKENREEAAEEPSDDEEDESHDEQSVKPQGKRLAVRFFATSTQVLARIDLPHRLNPHRVRLDVQAYSLRISILPERKGRLYTLPAPIDPDTAQAAYHHHAIEFSAQRLDSADWGRPVPICFPEEDQ